jgi:hypothetical protein
MNNNNDSKELKTKERIVLLLIKSMDENKCIDIGKFRKEHSSEYALLNHYFGSVDEAVNVVGGVKITTTQTKVKLRDRLAYDMITFLRKDNSLEQIAKKYHVTRSGINQLYHHLSVIVNRDKK